MGFTNLWPLLFLLTIPPLVLLYILKRKYKEEVVSSSLLWKEVYKNTRANTPWEKFKKNIMLLIQILIVLSLILAIMGPFLNFGGKSYKNVIIVIDNSASMNTLYNKTTTRLEKAKNLAKEYLNSTKDGTKAYVISHNNTSNLVLNGEFNKSKSESTISKIENSFSSGDINNSIPFIKAIGDSINEEYEILIFTDNQMPIQDVEGKVIYLGNSGLNASIDKISHKFIGNKIKVIANVTNNGDCIYNGDFSLYNCEELVLVENLSLQVGESKTLNFELDSISGNYIKGNLSKKDILLEDNTYYHIVSENKLKKILLITEENIFLEKAFSAIENVEIYKTNDTSNIPNDADFDLYIFDNKMPEYIPQKGSLLFINPTSNELFNISKGGEIGEAIVVNGTVSSYLENTKFTLSQYNALETPYYADNFLTVNSVPVGFKGDLDNRKIAALSFDLHFSDFVLKKEFPILIYELGEELISTGMVYSNNFEAGEKIIVKSCNYEDEIEVIYPNGQIKMISTGSEIRGEKALGIYKLNQNNNQEIFSVNFPTKTESDTSVEKIGENQTIIDGNISLRSGINLNSIFILLSMIIIAFEWILYKKGN